MLSLLSLKIIDNNLEECKQFVEKIKIIIDAVKIFNLYFLIYCPNKITDKYCIKNEQIDCTKALAYLNYYSISCFLFSKEHFADTKYDVDQNNIEMYLMQLENIINCSFENTPTNSFFQNTLENLKKYILFFKDNNKYNYANDPNLLYNKQNFVKNLESLNTNSELELENCDNYIQNNMNDRNIFKIIDNNEYKGYISASTMENMEIIMDLDINLYRELEYVVQTLNIFNIFVMIFWSTFRSIFQADEDYYKHLIVILMDFNMQFEFEFFDMSNFEEENNQQKEDTCSILKKLLEIFKNCNMKLKNPATSTTFFVENSLNIARNSAIILTLIS
ncbi:hypothetical protein EDEG_02441 [Edhazardia aedis USNM 41457]|uniref:Uncharacterized protein n=1 Tax=Edhazardia aedis (strain USNM 41457) TaxID=1003232 RepID=J8ZU52_EDHAE|nr:hypothetical protein EDEG_02441 [Edhazardia aedis USNM 41457]|eukprot:EJW03188.1 hypothetical protein EDEG_02441 [Edhazardia aedis USNM 41457]